MGTEKAGRRAARSHGKARVVVLLVLCAAVFAVFLGRLFVMQFILADHYAAKAAAAASSSYSYAETAARGAITDRNGTVLAQDVPIYDVYLRTPAPPGTTLAKTLAQTQECLNEQGSKDVETQLAAFCVGVPAGEFLLASGVDAQQAAAVYQAGLTASGAVRLALRGTRTWAQGTLFPHLLGVTGAISAEQWQADDYALRAAGYPMNAIIGQSGLEAALETTLRGTDGRARASISRTTGALTETELAAPKPGQTVVLTVDAAVQSMAQQALQAQIETLRTTKPVGQGQEVSAGSVVIVRPKTGEILAAVSWPGYDLNQYTANYAALAQDPAQPLFDRVCRGLYAPGSAFKPAVAVGALSAGTVTPQDTVDCTGTYTFYPGYQPHCLQLGHSGPVDLATALKYSCNIYFYDVGRRLGVDAFSAAAQSLGLAADAGAELPAAAGRLTWSSDANYQAGLALQAAIGQANTAVTPLQLAAYASTLANSGVRYRLHFVAATRDGTTGQTLTTVQPEVLGTVPGGEAVFGPVRTGMQEMAGTLLALRGAPVTLACKTGSPQLAAKYGENNYTNSVLIAYAPADDPQIAVSIVLEYGGGGANAAPILRNILDYFFTS